MGLVLASSSDTNTVSASSDDTITTTSAPKAEVPAELSDAELGKQFGDAVWRVEVDGCGVTATGTAFAIAENLLVTNHHVVAVDPTPTLRSRHGKTLEGRVVGMSQSPDIAVIRVDAPLPTTLQWAPTAQLTEGDHILGLGYPVPDLDFTATPGSVLSFRVVGKTREAIRSDGAFDRGNSGGPALNTKGQVVGVITEMALSDGFQNVPLLFTHDAVASQVDAFSKRADTVAPDCSSPEPPPVPDWFDDAAWDDYFIEPPALPPVEVPEFEVPEIEIPEYVPPTTAPCPAGEATGSVTEVNAVEEDPEYLPGYYTVTVRGLVTNPTSAPMTVFGVEVDVSGYGTTFGSPDGYGELAPGQSTGWEAMAFVDSPGGPPTATLAGVDWMWGWEHSHC